MKLTDYTDTCFIARDTGGSDDYGNPLRMIVYDGPCLYEEGGQSNADRIIVRSPLVFLPTNDVLVYTNDMVEVRTYKGRVIKGLVERVRDVAMKFHKENITRIELKQGRGD